ncbi:MAG: class I SAM-dependent methyltransferase [SAR324 cluster bacterium]|nr:class I SAM-dependent methyltransferase [SAR324 cluster bacterium]
MDKDKMKKVGVHLATYAGGAMIAGLVYIGDKLGIFKAMAGEGEMTLAEVTAKTGLNERYVLEWLKAMLAAELVEQEPGTQTYRLCEEAAAYLADEEGRFFLAGMFQLAVPSIMLIDRLMESFRHGGGIRYDELGDEIVQSMDRLHKGPFVHLLAQSWLPQVPGLKERLEAGMRILDVGCGLGRSTLTVATHFPNSTVVGLEPDAFSCEGARKLSADAGIGNTEYLELPIQELPEGETFGLVLALDCIHDMVDPIGGLKAIRGALSEDGIFFWQEPIGSHDPLENQNPSGKMRQAISIYHCMTVSLAHGGAGLGTLIGEKGARELADRAGFSHFEKLPIKDPGQQFFRLHR